MYVTTGGKARFQADPDGGGGSAVSASTGGSLSDGVDFFFVCRWDPIAKVITISINGNLSGAFFASAAYTGIIFDATSDFYFGADATGGGSKLTGGMKQVGWWNRPITNAEVTWLYNTGSNRSYNELLNALPGGQGLPWSGERGREYIYVYEHGTWVTQEWTRPGVNTYFKRQTAGASVATGKQFTSGGGALTTPLFDLPGLEGKPKAVDRITFMGNLEASATDNTSHATCTVAVGGISASFVANHAFPETAKVAKFDATTVFDKLQMTLTGTPGTGGTDPNRYTPNFVPVKIEGYSWEPIGRLPEDVPLLPGG